LATDRTFHIDEVGDVRAAWADLEPLIAAIIEYHRPWDSRVLADDWAGTIRELMAGPGQFVLLGRDEAKVPVAFLHGSFHRSNLVFDDVFVFIENIYVVEAARGSGIGTDLVERFETWARQQGANEVRLHVNAGNAIGQRFWDREGFRPFEYLMRKPLEGTT
jgi:GNAT superfamily N-acetyltransferase